MNNCSNCNHSCPLDLNEVWPDDWEEAYQAEQQVYQAWLNGAINHMPKMTVKYWKDNYLDNVRRNKENIECRFLPTFVEKKKTDFCGQFKRVVYNV